jgi:hypothetical protein
VLAGKFIVVIGVDLPADSQQRDGNSAPAEYKRGSIGQTFREERKTPCRNGRSRLPRLVPKI